MHRGAPSENRNGTMHVAPGQRREHDPLEHVERSDPAADQTVRDGEPNQVRSGNEQKPRDRKQRGQLQKRIGRQPAGSKACDNKDHRQNREAPDRRGRNAPGFSEREHEALDRAEQKEADE